MSIARLFYVICDWCGDPCGGEHGLAWNASEARAVSKVLRWKRIKGDDVCPKCQESS